MHTPGGKQEVQFLTEQSLYELLFTSRKALAKEFKKHVMNLLRTTSLISKRFRKKSYYSTTSGTRTPSCCGAVAPR